MNDTNQSLPISALQHWLFCPRQCALVHVERLWEENRLTAEGRLLHERADAGRPESRKDVRILRSVQIASSRLRLHGVADVVELHKTRPYPVEYKRGRPKAHRADEVQLCAQAICLEEMMGKSVQEGALFYGTRQRRTVVSFDESLRTLTERVAKEMRDGLTEAVLPPPVYDPARCDACSLNELCCPQSQRTEARVWIGRRIAKAGVPE